MKGISIIRYCSLKSAHRDLEYPDFAPFYLYGTLDNVFVDHVLTKAPNVQVTAKQPVALELDGNLPLEQLESGLLALLDIPERARQPPGPDHSLIPDGTLKFGVRIYEDLRSPKTNGPGLASVVDARLLAKGTIDFVARPRVWEGLNVDRDPPHKNQDYPEPPSPCEPTTGVLYGAMPVRSRAEAWDELVKSFGLKH